MAAPLMLLFVVAVSVVVHEAGHAAAVSLMRLRLTSIRIGGRRARRIGVVRGVSLSLGLPISGRVQYRLIDRRMLAGRITAIALAGPAANGLFAALTIVTMPDRVDLVTVNVVMAVLNVLPMRWRGDPTDGLRALQARGQARKLRASLVFQAQLNELLAEAEKGASTEQLTAWRELAQQPEFGAHAAYGLAHTHAGLHHEHFARDLDLLIGHLRSGRLPEALRGCLANEIAWGIIQTMGPADDGQLAVAEEFSALACSFRPEDSASLHTRAEVMLAANRPHDAVEFATAALAHLADIATDENREEVALTLSQALAACAVAADETHAR